MTMILMKEFVGNIIYSVSWYVHLKLVAQSFVSPHRSSLMSMPLFPHLSRAFNEVRESAHSGNVGPSGFLPPFIGVHLTSSCKQVTLPRTIKRVAYYIGLVV